MNKTLLTIKFLIKFVTLTGLFLLALIYTGENLPDNKAFALAWGALSIFGIFGYLRMYELLIVRDVIVSGEEHED